MKNKPQKALTVKVIARATARGSDDARPHRPARRRRFPPHVREKMILDDAAGFFAEHGFDANIRDLANNSGVSQALIFKYFGSKEKLAFRVYERTFLQRWRPEWERILSDQNTYIGERLGEFYKSYLQTVDDYAWIRIALFSGLSANNLTARYVQENVSALMHLIAEELRVECREPLGRPLGPLEMEQVWMLHSTFIYYLIRKHIYRMPTAEDQSAYVDLMVSDFLNGRLTLAAKRR